MAKYIKLFEDLSENDLVHAGGKGGTLATLHQRGYAVPGGMVVFPTAFSGSDLKEDAWKEIKSAITAFQKGKTDLSFAVRSSALAEDSAYASFAGEYETVLDVRSIEAVRAAIIQVQKSRESERVKSYSKAKGLDGSGTIAVVIQELVRADISGILFTADPVTGNRFEMKGNYIYGFGEALVSGEAEPFTFSLFSPKGTYEGPDNFRKYAKRLFRLGQDLENEFSCPQDIEWAIADGKVHVLQSRPITTLEPYDPATGEWNHSRTGDFLWVGNEVFPDVMTPSTWSIFEEFQKMNIFNIAIMGNIYGRMYMNFSLAFKMFELLNKDADYIKDYTALTTGFTFDYVTIPSIEKTKWQLVKVMVPNMVRMLPKQYRLMGKFEQIIQENPSHCQQLIGEISTMNQKEEIAAMWEEQLFTLYWNLLQVQDKANEDYFYPYLAAKTDLKKLIGQEAADALFAKITAGSAQLASTQPLMELQRLSEGLISREAYALIAGHRPEKENELYTPRLYEQEGWIEERLAAYNSNPRDYIRMAKKSGMEFERAWNLFATDYPAESKKIRKKLDKTLHAMEKREIIRSELTRALGVIRAWYLKCGQVLDIGDDIFFLKTSEVVCAMLGDPHPLSIIPIRKDGYHRQLKRPANPFVISGRFDIEMWMKDKNRRSDVFDSHAEIHVVDEEGVISGHAGSAGRTEGTVRVILSPADGEQLKEGEILVAATTNVGWTPIFPKALAVITDVGAPLSHAAIIARELGIPAVVGTGNATMRLKNGQKVIVDGGQGKVFIQ